MGITISGDDIKELEQIEDLARKLGLKISKKPSLPKHKLKGNKDLMKLMEDMAASGGIQSINDPIEWQRNIRSDRILPGRE